MQPRPMSNASHCSDKSHAAVIVDADRPERSAAGSVLSGHSFADHVRKRSETLRDIQRKIQGLDIREQNSDDLVSKFSSDSDSEISGKGEEEKTSRDRSEMRIFKYRTEGVAIATGEVIPSLPADIIDLGVNTVVIKQENITVESNDTLSPIVAEPTIARPHFCTSKYDVHVYTCRHFLTGLDALELGVFSTLSSQALHAIDTSLADIRKDEVYDIVGLCFNELHGKETSRRDFTLIIDIKVGRKDS